MIILGPREAMWGGGGYGRREGRGKGVHGYRFHILVPFRILRLPCRRVVETWTHASSIPVSLFPLFSCALRRGHPSNYSAECNALVGGASAFVEPDGGDRASVCQTPQPRRASTHAL